MKRVLIADDDRILRKVIARAIEKAGEHLQALEAEDGQAAVELLDSEDVDLVITDIHMPRMNGLMVLAYMNAFYPEIPCFVMTSYGTAQMLSKMPPDLLKFYHKPLDAHALAAAVVAALEDGPAPGKRQTVSLANFLDLVILEQLTCTVTVEAEGMDPGHLFIDKGVLFDAVMGDRRGQAVAIELLSRPDVNYSMETGCPATIQNQIDRPLGELIEKII